MWSSHLLSQVDRTFGCKSRRESQGRKSIGIFDPMSIGVFDRKSVGHRPKWPQRGVQPEGARKRENEKQGVLDRIQT